MRCQRDVSTGRGHWDIRDTYKVLGETAEARLDVGHAEEALELPFFESHAFAGLLGLGGRLAGWGMDRKSGRGDLACLDEMLGFLTSLFSLDFGLVGVVTNWGFGFGLRC